MDTGQKLSGVSWYRVVGFAFHLGYFYTLFYMGMNREFEIGSVSLERVELLGTLCVMIVTLLILQLLENKARAIRETMFETHSVAVYACMLVIGAFVPVVMGNLQTDELVFESIMVGFPWVTSLLVWARVLGRGTTERSRMEVFSGAALGALLCFVVCLIPYNEAIWLLKLLPIPAAVILIYELRHPSEDFETSLVVTGENISSSLGVSEFSLKVLMGATCFGLAAGFMETYNTIPGSAAMASFAGSLLLFFLFCLGAVQLFYSRDKKTRTGLDGPYRLALLVMMAGFLFAPVLQPTKIPGEAIVLAGYLGLSCVLIALFLACSKLSGEDPSVSVNRGFLALFVGEFIGVLLANLLTDLSPFGVTPYVVVSFAGLITLFAYLFLFTEKDFKAFSEIIQKSDRFEEACQLIVAQAQLSKRESEILPFALRGRTSERIASELYISKSTVDTHLRRIYTKTGVHSRQELIDLCETITEQLDTH